MITKSLHFKWTVSRGRDTYGYNICTLLVDGEKVAKCMGGGYDMQGTCLAEWLQNSYQSQLLEFCATLNVKNVSKRIYSEAISYEKFFGMTKWVHHAENNRAAVVLDGGCGFDSMKRIAEAIGIKLQWNKESDNYKNHTFYTAVIG